MMTEANLTEEIRLEEIGTNSQQESGELEEHALLSIAKEFSQVEKVKSIYVQRYREEWQVQVLLSISNYDEDRSQELKDLVRLLRGSWD